MQAHKLHLPLHLHHHQRHSSSSAVVVSSLLVEPSSRSLALMLSDSSVLLYPPVPLSFPPSSPFLPPTAVPPVCSSACFLRLQPCSDSDLGRVLFLSAACQGASVLLRSWILSGGGGGSGSQRFAPARLSYKQERLKLGIVLDLCHGFSVALAGSVNVCVLHSPAAGRIWVYAAKLSGEAGKEVPAVEVMKCAVIECTSPIFSTRLSPGFLLLGEVGGVRVFPLRPLVKGSADRRKDSRQKRHEERNQNLRTQTMGCRGKKLPNGLVADVVHGKNGSSHVSSGAHSKSTGCFCNSKGCQLVEGGVNATSDSPCRGRADTERPRAKLRTVKLKQNSGDLSSYFVAIDSLKRSSFSSLPVKAISIHILSHKRFLILDSTGDLHLLSLSNPILASETTINTSQSSKDGCMIRLDYTMKVRMLAVLPDLSMRTQIVWISDAFHSIHIIPLADVVENDKDSSERKLAEVSDIQAIFTGERIRDIAPLSANAVMILGQGGIFVYSIA